MAITPQQVKLLRQRLNKVENGFSKLPNPSREKSLALTSLQESSMFLGLVLGDMDEKTPYIQSSNPENDVIEARADVSDSEFNFESDEEIKMVKELRSEMEIRLIEVKEIYKTASVQDFSPEKSIFAPSHLVTSITSLEKSRMWLGMDLNRIKNKAELDALGKV